MMVRDFHKCIGEEARRQILEAEGRLPDTIFACVGGGINAIGIFHAFLAETSRATDRHRSRRPQRATRRTRGAFPRRLSRRAAGRAQLLLQDDDGQMSLTHSVSAGLDYADDRSGACVAARSEPRGICVRVDSEALEAALHARANRGHHSRARIGARA